MVSKTNIMYYRYALQQLLKDAEENEIDIGFHIQEITIQNKTTKDKVCVYDKKFHDHKYIRD